MIARVELGRWSSGLTTTAVRTRSAREPIAATCASRPAKRSAAERFEPVGGSRLSWNLPEEFSCALGILLSHRVDRASVQDRPATRPAPSRYRAECAGRRRSRECLRRTGNGSIGDHQRCDTVDRRRKLCIFSWFRIAEETFVTRPGGQRNRDRAFAVVSGPVRSAPLALPRPPPQSSCIDSSAGSPARSPSPLPRPPASPDRRPAASGLRSSSAPRLWPARRAWPRGSGSSTCSGQLTASPSTRPLTWISALPPPDVAAKENHRTAGPELGDPGRIGFGDFESAPVDLDLGKLRPLDPGHDFLGQRRGVVLQPQPLAHPAALLGHAVDQEHVGRSCRCRSPRSGSGRRSVAPRAR